jgi:hypothetical protein
MAAQVFLETRLQCSEQFFTMFWAQLLFIALHVFHSLDCRRRKSLGLMKW